MQIDVIGLGNPLLDIIVDISDEQLKELTRGKSITKEGIQTFIENLDIPRDAKDYLLKKLKRADMHRHARPFYNCKNLDLTCQFLQLNWGLSDNNILPKEVILSLR